MWKKQGIKAVFYFGFLYFTDLKALAQVDRCAQIRCYFGECRIDNDTKEPYCHCSKYYMGPTCLTSIKRYRCNSFKCSAIESCVADVGANKWVCECDVSKYGILCYTSSSSVTTTRALTTTYGQKEKDTSSSKYETYIGIGTIAFIVSVFVIIYSPYRCWIKRRRRRPSISCSTTCDVSMHNLEAKDEPVSSVFAVAPSYEEACSNSNSPPSYEEAAQSSSHNFYHISAI